MQSEQARKTIEPRAGILATLLDYAGPLLDGVLQDAPPEGIQDLLLFAAVVWNAVIQQQGDAGEAARGLIADMKSKGYVPPPDGLVLWLAHRKAIQFDHDTRLIKGPELERELDRYEAFFEDTDPASSGEPA